MSQALLRHTFRFFFRCLTYFHWNLTDLGPWRQNNMWKLLRNDSGVILNYWTLIWNHFSIKKSIFGIYIWNMSLDINSKDDNNSNLIFKSQHLVINPGQGPALKCAPGQDSIKDSSIIKSYWLKSGVMDKQNLISWFGAKSGWGQILNRFTIRWPRTDLRIFWKKSNWYNPNQNQPMFWGSECMLLGSRVVPNWEFSEYFQSGKPSGEVVPIWEFSDFFRIGFQKRI